MSLIMKMRENQQRGTIPGVCAHCTKKVYESLFTLDDAYNVWAGECPFCKAINLLSLNHGLRGYSSSEMWLVLPTIEERSSNDLPATCPVSGSGGEPTIHGTNLGEICHQLTKEAQGNPLA